ncbi:MAG: hypothetical protein H6744_08300 [Deltaproteobacteria bacterium]|nr:hypothetical protein [Deltaproteobacteria bacterium]
MVDLAAIDGISEPEFALSDGPIEVGATDFAGVLPTAGGAPFCQAKVPFTATSTTPEICTTASADLDFFGITGVKAGTCEYTLTIEGAASGAGLSADFSVEIVEP